jgi:hypothetical protein
LIVCGALGIDQEFLIRKRQRNSVASRFSVYETKREIPVKRKHHRFGGEVAAEGVTALAKQRALCRGKLLKCRQNFVLVVAIAYRNMALDIRVPVRLLVQHLSRATAAAPSELPPPPMFSTIIVPSSGLTCSTHGRARVSNAPPGGNGTTSRIGRDG